MKEEPKKRILKVDLSGKDENLFKKLKGRLVDAVEKFLDSTIEFQTGTTVREETKKLTSLALNFAEEKLKKAGIENHKLLAEIEEKYSLAEKNKAEARKTIAESRRIEFEQSLKELALSLKLSKVLIIGKKGEEAMVLAKQIDAFLDAIEEIQEHKKMIE